MAIKIVNDDVIKWAREYKGKPFMALFADVPYSLGDGTKGFMNKEWDNDVACNPETWRALAEHLLFGAFLFVFAGTLNDDLISVAMRQAGLRKFHKTINWGFGSGFPKATNIAAQIDKSAGLIKHRGKAFVTAGHGSRKDIIGTNGHGVESYNNPKSPLAKTWAGHRYGLQGLKPSAETILIFQKPYDGKAVDSIVKNGAGALNVDGGRISTKDNLNGGGYSGGQHKGSSLGFTGKDGRKEASQRLNPDDFVQPAGRWPANLLLQHDHRCNGTCHPDCAIAALDEQAGSRPSGGRKAGESWIRKGEITGFGGKYAEKCTGVVSRDYVSDSGGASRFFFNSDWSHEVQEQIENADAVRYQAKASRRERNSGISEFYWQKNKKSSVGFDRITYVEWKKLPNEDRAQGNIHSTVKPISLTKYLATLLASPVEYAPRRILIPFAGVMSEVLGAFLSGHWEEVAAVEKEKEYCDIGKARVKYWEKHREPQAKPTRKTEAQEEMLQHSLF